jgi:hypothetical protein
MVANFGPPKVRFFLIVNHAEVVLYDNHRGVDTTGKKVFAVQLFARQRALNAR